MALPFLFHVLGLLSFSLLAPLLFSSPISPSRSSVLQPGSFLSVENQDDFLISPNGIFTAGFYKVGENAYCFSIWYTKPLSDGSYTAVWMANRDVPVNGKRSKLSLLKTGNLMLTDADQPLPVWTAGIIDSSKSAQLMLNNTGNLFLQNQDNETIWQSFDSPTDTLLPLQPFTKDTTLVSSRSSTSFSQGFYKLFFDNDNVLRLVYNGPKIAGTYWPDPQQTAWVSGRSTWAPRRTAVLDSSGHFVSSDSLFFNTSDAEDVLVRRLTMDVDGNLRAYSLDEIKGVWKVTWQAISDTCQVQGICGENSTCSISPTHGRKCSCLPNHQMINQTDWSYGCAPVFNTTLCGNDEDNYVAFPNYDFYGYDARFVPNTTLDQCKKVCASICNCKGFLFNFDIQGFYSCYAKFKLINGFGTVRNGTMYLKVPKSISLQTNNNMAVQEFSLTCSEKSTIKLDRAYVKNPKNESLKFMKLFTYIFGALEIVCIICFFYKTRNPLKTRRQGYLQTVQGFQRFSYAELKKASDNFSKELGRGGGGIVYKGILPDNRVAAIKVLKEFDNNQGEAELLAEISTLGRINHMNLIDIWGYCVERKHRMLVYEYMENGSLAQNLQTNKLDWAKRFDIAVGTAKGLAYLHEECLEWVLHCDVKPHNILLDSNFSPKVADFGLSKLLDRDVTHKEFTKARGTRGYMAPEWLFLNQPITSKVDVYSYGVVMLEMITGKIRADDQNLGSKGRLDSWVAEKMIAADGKNGWIRDVVDSTVQGKYDTSKMEVVIKLALRCLEEDKDARPTMRQVVDMLLRT
uniref:putative receptor protein kinase ZmPK1 n=1 Tax=Erigeron canadensis TaxID=72917 RepID=UPI001CB94C8D|nr:putative receptor protein kinase ZmPK1 [Erigeron canadensis]